MTRMICIALAVLITGTAGMAQPRSPVAWKMSERGLVTVSDDSGKLAELGLLLHAPGWGSSVMDLNATATRDGDKVTGSMPCPAPSTGALRYTATARSVDGVAEMDFRAEFTEATTIEGAYVSVFLPCTRFEGARATLPPNAAAQVLPPRGGPLALGGVSSAFAVAAGGGKTLVIATDAPVPVTTQDDRQYGADQYQVRLPLRAWQGGARDGRAAPVPRGAGG